MRSECVLLIGGNGFIGQALARQLAAEGREVHVLARHAEAGRRDGINFHRGCQSDTLLLAPLLRCCDAVVHLASTTTPGRSAQAPALEMAENMLPLAKFLQAQAEVGSRRLIFFSSGGAIYGNPSYLPVGEDQPTCPRSWHATGKLAAEAMFATAALQTGSPLAILRPANLYGPGQVLQSDFGLVRTLLERALSGEPVDIWGDGQQVRDYLYIDDLVSACIGLLDRHVVTGVFNAGTGVGTTVLELVDLTQYITGRQLPLRYHSSRGIDVEKIWLDCRKLHDVLGWRAAVSLEDGVGKTWTWLRGR
jgi:UDP-glucose 4-epimerase